MNKEPGTELNSAFLETKEREDWKRLNQKFSNGKQQEKKRGEKAAGTDKVRQEKMETESRRSGISNISKVSRSTNGRFEGKYKIGDKAANGSVIKEIKEDDWELLSEKDKKGNSYFKCLHCTKAPRVLKSDRKKHSCKQV